MMIEDMQQEQLKLNIDEQLQIARKLMQENNLPKAEAVLKEILKQDNTVADAYYLMSSIADLVKKKDIAVQLIFKAISYRPLELYFMRVAYILIELEKYDQAIDCYKKVINTRPQNVSAHINLGVCYSRKEMYKEALEAYEKSIELNPESPDAYCNYGVALKNIQKIDEAFECYQKSLKYSPNHVDATYNCGVICSQDFGKPKKAIEYYTKVIELNPKYSDVYLNLGISYLLDRNFELGWKYYDHRFYNIQEPAPAVKNKKPKWQGESLKDKVIYVYREQGIGDSIQFVRLLSLLKKFKPKKILFKSHEGIEPILKMSIDDAEIIDSKMPDDLVEFDVYTLLLDIPKHAGYNYEDIEKPKRYLKTDYNKVIVFKNKFFNHDDYKIGIFWQGNPEHKKDKLRSIPLQLFSKLLDLPKTKIYSLQKGHGAEQLDTFPKKDEIINLGKHFHDFSDTAAAIEGLDLVITIDSAIAHLAGAMGKEVWVILPSNYEWRWFTDMSKTIWYEKMTLFRPKYNQDKIEIIDKIYTKLLKKLKQS